MPNTPLLGSLHWGGFSGRARGREGGLLSHYAWWLAAAGVGPHRATERGTHGVTHARVRQCAAEFFFFASELVVVRAARAGGARALPVEMRAHWRAPLAETDAPSSTLRGPQTASALFFLCARLHRQPCLSSAWSLPFFRALFMSPHLTLFSLAFPSLAPRRPCAARLPLCLLPCPALAPLLLQRLSLQAPPDW